MRADKKKSLSAVAKELIRNPIACQREIADNTWLSLWCVNDKVKELELIGWKDPTIIYITDKDLSIVTIGQREIEKRLSTRDELEKMRTVEISQVIRESTARYSLFRWNATDKDGWLKESAISEDQALIIAERILWRKKN